MELFLLFRISEMELVHLFMFRVVKYEVVSLTYTMCYMAGSLIIIPCVAYFKLWNS